MKPRISLQRGIVTAEALLGVALELLLLPIYFCKDYCPAVVAPATATATNNNNYYYYYDDDDHYCYYCC